jgi:hypothetical protein
MGGELGKDMGMANHRGMTGTSLSDAPMKCYRVKSGN